jgi:hypothetical protein
MKKLWGKYLINFTTKYLLLFLNAMCAVATSCGHRKTELSKIETKKDTLISVLSEKKIKVDSNYTFDFSTFKIYPIDFSKPIIINGNTIKNASIEGINKRETGSIQKITESKEKEIKKSSTKTFLKTKETEKSDNAFLYIGLFFVFCLFVFACLKFPSFKKDI